jgi:hypothetical protein
MNQLPMAGRNMSEMLPKPQSPVLVSLEGGNCLTRKGQRLGGNAIFVPVVSETGKPLMPYHSSRARELIKDNFMFCNWLKKELEDCVEVREVLY